MVRRVVFAAAALIALSAGATSARAATVPAGVVIRVRGAIDLDAFARAIASRYEVVLRRIVAADIDRDGDLDVLATSDRDLLVWLNDGTGRLTSTPPSQAPAIDCRAPADTWRDARQPRDETIQNEPPSPRLSCDAVHAPPPPAGFNNGGAARADLTDPQRASTSPRAPPAHVLAS